MATRVSVRRVRGSAIHEGFLWHGGGRWAKIAGSVAAFVIIVYALHDPEPRPNGGSWYGYILGTVGVGLILWLTALGLRKRAMTQGRWSLKSWTSAHVWLGMTLIVIGTLHTGFQFGWNVHTLAYVLMMVVIVSGMLGVFGYATLPRALSDNRGETTEPQMLEALRSVDRQLHEAGATAGAAPCQPGPAKPRTGSVRRGAVGTAVGPVSALRDQGGAGGDPHRDRIPSGAGGRSARTHRRAARAQGGGTGARAAPFADQGAAGNLALCPCASDICADCSTDRSYYFRVLLLVSSRAP